MSELQGLVLKNYNGYYYVKVEDDIFTCKVKGRMKQNRFSLATGDLVLLEAGKAGEGMIKRVLPRKNFLPRPTMANLDLFVATFACAAPDFSFLLADKLLALAELAKIPTILVLNKEDQAPSGLIERVRGIYEAIGYEVFTISAKNGTGVEALRERLKGKICAFGGPSGVGKSSTINAIDINVDLAAFREVAEFEAGCRFCPCSHTHEPVCGVKEAVRAGKIAASRYESYLAMLEEIRLLKEKEGRK